MAFNRSRNGGSDRGGFRPVGRPRFNDRGSNRGPVEMHKAICDNCRRECEVPFRPTSGKPVYCSNCFENQRGGSESIRSEGRNEDRQMFDAVCDECGNKCQVPFQPSGDKPVFCSNCFGEKKNAEPRNTQPSQNNGQQFNEQLEALNSKLDKILKLLSPVVPVEKPVKAAKKKVSVKKSPKVSEAPADAVEA